MLLEFRCKNYKSFKDECVYSMIPAPKQRDLYYSILKDGNNKKIKALSSAVIYGPNASGKTNLIGALDTFRSIVNRGNIENVGAKQNNLAASSLELIPNIGLKNKEPVTFSIKAYHMGKVFEYGLSIDLGKFIEDYEGKKRKISKEYLKINDNIIFDRTNNKIEFGDKFLDFENLSLVESKDVIKTMAENTLIANDRNLFLVYGFKTIVNNELSALVTDWFKNSLNIIYNSNKYNCDLRINNISKKDHIIVQDSINKIAKELGLGGSEIGYKKKENSDGYSLMSLFHFNNKNYAIPSSVIESTGTLRIMEFLYPLISAIQHGETLVIDEFDNCLHPNIMMNIINIFHNDEININKAQLIFNTHNPMFLNKNIYRRDEIKFVDRDEYGCSYHYSLSDVKLNENKSIRSSAAYMKNYFINKYGAIKYFDISDIFADLVNQTGLRRN